MSQLVFLESQEGKIKSTSLEAVAFAHAMGGQVTAIAMGSVSTTELEAVGKYGDIKILHANDSKFDKPTVAVCSNAIEQAMRAEKADVLILSNSSFVALLGASVAVKLKANIALNVVELPKTSPSFKVKQSVFSGKAYVWVEMKSEKKVISIKKNAVELKESGGKVTLVAFNPTLKEKDFNIKVISGTKATGEISLSDASIIVSGGRGMKGAENWGILEELAKSLNAATGCSKPVSDLGWRPHHEHVGQTGIKVAPQLYIAVGISGAIQHIAGVNASKCIVVINSDPEAPFFKVADFGVVGDAFDVVPKLTAAIKNMK